MIHYDTSRYRITHFQQVFLYEFVVFLTFKSEHIKEQGENNFEVF